MPEEKYRQDAKMDRLSLLYSKTQLAGRVDQLADMINRDYQGKELVVVGILKGTFVFLADLVRCLKLPIIVDFVGTSSYGLGSQPSHQITLTKDIQVSVQGKHVLIVEDILDTGLTANFVLNLLKQREPASLRLCALIDKKERRIVPVTADYVGFELEEGFVVGYGIDYAERYRHLPNVYRLRLSTD